MCSARLKKYYSILCFIFVMLATTFTYAQPPIDTKRVMPTEDYDNIHIKTLKQDSVGSTFLIWVKNEVINHYHQNHIEEVFILKGTGIMRLGDNSFAIKAGDYLLIPKNSIHGVKVTSKDPLKVLSIQSPKFTGNDRIVID